MFWSWFANTLHVEVLIHLVLKFIEPNMCETKKYISFVFKMKDLNEEDTILGIKIKRHNEGFSLC